jgi:glycosyltransferase involved in cell wall biosynthesis
MAFHILLPRFMHLEQGAVLSERHEAPRHAMWLLAKELGASIHEPDGSPAEGIDKLFSTVLPTGPLWSLARKVCSSVNSSDVIFCSSEAGGLQLAAACGKRPRRPRIVVFVHNVNRPRARFALRWWQMAEKVDLFLACTEVQVGFLRQFLKLSDDRVRFVGDHTDIQFFSPGSASVLKPRPLVVSVGLEQRDYKTLAAATHDLNVDVRISGFSKDAAMNKHVFPETLPSNMTRRFYEWPELVQLYRDADIVVVSCRPSKYAAGVQSLMEARACKRPVIATLTEGLKSYLDDSVLAVDPGDALAMRQAIIRILGNAADANQRAARGYEVALGRYDITRYVAEIAETMRSLASV